MGTNIIPEGFALLDRDSPFSDLTGPYYEKLDSYGKHEVLAIRLSQEHLNKVRLAHGGLLMTLADNAFGDAIKAHHDKPVSFVTVSFNSEFLAAAHAGDWVEARVTINRAGRRLIFAQCALSVDAKNIFNASAVFAIIELSPDKTD
ncbi:MAG: PaaI family thioesterase [Alcaligenaceae bacterium]|nr:PaaI family thioesterase [Alcaligenaceae bacterium]